MYLYRQRNFGKHQVGLGQTLPLTCIAAPVPVARPCPALPGSFIFLFFGTSVSPALPFPAIWFCSMFLLFAISPPLDSSTLFSRHPALPPLFLDGNLEIRSSLCLQPPTSSRRNESILSRLGCGSDTLGRRIVLLYPCHEPGPGPLDPGFRCPLLRTPRQPAALRCKTTKSRHVLELPQSPTSKTTTIASAVPMLRYPLATYKPIHTTASTS